MIITNKKALCVFNNMLTIFSGGVIYAVASRSWNALSGIVTLILITKYLSPLEQGYYYTLISLMTMQIIFELGFGVVIRQFISHEFSRLRYFNGALMGDCRSLNNIRKILLISSKWYGVVIILINLVVLPLGWWFFSTSAVKEGVVVDWQLPWFLLVSFSSISLFIISLVTILEGIGFVREVQILRFKIAIISSLVSWFLLVEGGALYIPASNAIILITVNLLWCFRKQKKVFIQLFLKGHTSLSNINWTKDILPLQWKIGVSWLCGFFIFQLINPVAFRFYGPEVSGQIGISLAICNLALSLGQVLPNLKMPHFGLLIAKNEIVQFDKEFNRIYLASSLFVVFILVAVFVLLSIFDIYSVMYLSNIKSRMLNDPLLVLLFLATLSRHIVGVQACYIRCYRQEIHMMNAIYVAFFVFIGLPLVANYMSLNYFMFLYFFIISFFMLPHSTLIFRKFRRQRFVINCDTNI